MKKTLEYLLILMLTYLAFSFISNDFNPTNWTKGDKIMCLIIIALLYTSHMFIDEKPKN